MHDGNAEELTLPAGRARQTACSLTDPRIQSALALRDRAERDRTGRFQIEGLRFLIRAGQRKYPIETIFYSPGDMPADTALNCVRSLSRLGVATLRVGSETLRRLAWRDDPQGVVAIARQRWQPLAMATPAAGLCWVAADGVALAGNVGTILRTLECVGGAGLIVTGDVTDPYDPSAVRASMGAILGQRLVRTTIDELLLWARRHNAPVVATSPAARRHYQSVRYPRGTILMVGGERQGLDEERQAAADTVVSIPMTRGADSLNVGVATGVVLYEVYNQSIRRR
jgi:TrmH family RNA methyltransferase